MDKVEHNALHAALAIGLGLAVFWGYGLKRELSDKPIELQHQIDQLTVENHDLRIESYSWKRSYNALSLSNDDVVKSYYALMRKNKEMHSNGYVKNTPDAGSCGHSEETALIDSLTRGLQAAGIKMDKLEKLREALEFENSRLNLSLQKMDRMTAGCNSHGQCWHFDKEGTPVDPSK